MRSGSGTAVYRGGLATIEETRRDRTREEGQNRRREKTWSEEERRLEDGFLQSCIILAFSLFYEVSHSKSEINWWDKQLTAVIFSQFEHDTHQKKNPQVYRWNGSFTFPRVLFISLLTN
ncbi:hypothetical protein TNIN_302941 [Trichonephila inaurata madagascariensis]|uniref:Uncharacterized protein n=1 Tax=Trichonephila inaurata madagascariensis TaxID=2747483 RepID=A0A8X6X3G2_9ARAC|nr:hypothetical protein TNIN_302941 [Trichonephila inaurata madagascariensis]